MYDVEKCSSVLEECSWLCEIRHVYIQSRNKMAALGYAYILGKQTSHSPEHCTGQNAIGTRFLEF